MGDSYLKPGDTDPGSYQTQEPEDDVEDLSFGEEVLAEFNAGQGFQEGDGPVLRGNQHRRKVPFQQKALDSVTPPPPNTPAWNGKRL